MKTTIKFSSSALLLVLLLSFSSCAEEDTVLSAPQVSPQTEYDTDNLAPGSTNTSDSNNTIFRSKPEK